jgi:hypothetical protein
MKRAIFPLAAVVAATATPALAHTGVGSVVGFAAGFSHPVGGPDHMLAMVARRHPSGSVEWPGNLDGARSLCQHDAHRCRR